ncbi:MAG: hypothetical protein AAGA83_02530 [Cyanobacteria bacterium P01_F01_bin.116]
MKLKSLLTASLFSIGLSLSSAASVWAKEFQPIEQPIPLKLGITLASFGLIALELWWFLGKKK